jgi:hypothetical protein
MLNFNRMLTNIRKCFFDRVYYLLKLPPDILRSCHWSFRLANYITFQTSLNLTLDLENHNVFTFCIDSPPPSVTFELREVFQEVLRFDLCLLLVCDAGLHNLFDLIGLFGSDKFRC